MKTLHHAGHTLTELMVGMAISGLLLAGVAQAFFANTQTFAVVSEQSVLQENGRLALQLIGAQLRQTGYVQEISPQHFYDTQLRDEVFPPLSDVEFAGLDFAAGAVVGGLDNAGSANVRDGSDVLVLRYEKTITGEGLFRDCAGTVLDEDFEPNSAIAGFFVDDEFTLRCVRADGQQVQLIDGVEDMQVLYGLDADGLEPVRADVYRTAAELDADDWPRVIAVNVALLARPGESAISPPRDRIVRAYDVNGEVRQFDDSVARTVYNQTFLIRNRSF